MDPVTMSLQTLSYLLATDWVFIIFITNQACKIEILKTQTICSTNITKDISKEKITCYRQDLCGKKSCN